MKVCRSVLFQLCFLSVLVMSTPNVLHARVMMTGMVNQFTFNIMPTAYFTVDDWLSNPNMWSVAISNSSEGNLTVNKMTMRFTISSSQFPVIADGTIRVIDSQFPAKALKDRLLPGETLMINNTMVQEGKEFVNAGKWSNEFVDEVLRVGYLPEGQYTMVFVLEGNYSNGTSFSGSSDDLLKQVIEIELKNPSPPELMTPVNAADDVVSIPRFTWQKPAVNNFGRFGTVQIFYTLKLWKMFDDSGNSISDEDAIARIPIWQVSGLQAEAVDFNPNNSREELISGRSYCWQVQAFDGTGRYITETNQGKSDVWNFTIQFTPPELNDPTAFLPLSVTWQPARAGGAAVFYRVRLSQNADLSNAYEMRNLATTRFTYPSEEPALKAGSTYYLEVQTTDAQQIPLGSPVMTSFQLPALTANLVSPADESLLPSAAPVFAWSGNTSNYIVTMVDESRNWTYTSSAISGTRLVYSGEPLRGGATYAWNVTPANQFGDLVGSPSETWRFTLPGANQVTLISPVGEGVDTIYPTFMWDAPADVPVGTTYTITITDAGGSVVHTGTSTTAQYIYPNTATLLKYGARYFWTIGTSARDITVSGAGSFYTPFITTEGAVVSMQDISNAIKTVMGDAPEFSGFENKILVDVSDSSGPLTPATLIELLNKYRLTKVTVR